MKSKLIIITTSLTSIICANAVVAQNNLLTGVTISGTAQIEAQYSENYAGADTSDIVVDEFELALEAQVHPMAKANVSFLYEEDGTPLEIDEAIITLGEDASPIYFSVGQMYVPFGRFDSHMISDSLTLELGETREKAALLGFSQSGWYASAYVFTGDTEEGAEDKINHYGATLGFGQELEQISYDFGIDYISDLGDSDGVTGILEEIAPAEDVTELHNYEYVDGASAHLSLNIAGLSLIGEYVTALDEFNHIIFNGRGAEPKAWNAEIGYTFDLSEKETTFALGYQATEEAIALGLPETRMLADISVEIFNNTTVSIEYAQDEDYDVNDGGTGKDAKSIILQLALEF